MVPWYDMIQVQILALEDLATVLARVLVALEDVVAGELHILAWKFVEHRQHNDAWDPHLQADRLDRLGMRFFLRQIGPLGKVKGIEGAILVAQNHLGVTLDEETKSPADSADVDRLPKPIENQYGLVE